VLSDRFLDELGLPDADVFLGVGSGSHAEQTAGVMIGVERHLREEPAEAVLVAGDVNSTLAASLAAAKLGVAVIHLESGLRSGDWTMPEEINRVLTDRMADLLLCPGEDARENLEREGIPRARIAVVGNTMIDSLQRLLPAAMARSPRRALGLEARGYLLATLHRPSLVDDAERLADTLGALAELSGELPVVLPLHPRTRSRIESSGTRVPDGIMTVEPLGYLDFIALEAEARLVVTDSGGVQEETTALGVPCLTYRTSTERPVTIAVGTNALVGVNPARLTELGRRMLTTAMPSQPPVIPLWDGAAGPRAAAAIARALAAAPAGERLGP
jgi:UDP-N-acetylglucosamine 2-epimerase (non-hydrolysing)